MKKLSKGYEIAKMTFPTEEGLLNDGTRRLIDARMLHAELGVGRAFSHWITELIERHQLVEGEHYNRVPHIPKPGGLRMGTDYLLHPSVALEIAIFFRKETGPRSFTMESLIKENRRLRDYLATHLHDYFSRYPSAKQLLMSYRSPGLPDEMKAKACGYESVQKWQANIDILTSIGAVEFAPAALVEISPVK